MSSDHEHVNFEEFHEIRDWLERNDYKGTKSNWDFMRYELASIIKSYFDKDSSQHLTWEELDEYHKDFPSDFEDLEN